MLVPSSSSYTERAASLAAAPGLVRSCPLLHRQCFNLNCHYASHAHILETYTGLPLPLCCLLGLHKVKYSLVGTGSTLRQQLQAEFENITG